MSHTHSETDSILHDLSYEVNRPVVGGQDIVIVEVVLLCKLACVLPLESVAVEPHHTFGIYMNDEYIIYMKE